MALQLCYILHVHVTVTTAQNICLLVVCIFEQHVHLNK